MHPSGMALTVSQMRSSRPISVSVSFMDSIFTPEHLPCKGGGHPHTCCMRWFFLLLPWAELFTLIKLGGSIGALATLFYVFATFVLGMGIVRLQGMELIGNLRQAEYGQFVSRQMLASELAVGLGGLLLIIPGLITDTLGAVILISALLQRVFAPKSVEIRPQGGEFRRGETLEGEFRNLDD